MKDRTARDRVEGRREEGSEEDQRRLEGGARVSASASASARSRSLWRWTEPHPALAPARTDRTEWIVKMDTARGRMDSDDPIQAYTGPSRRGLKHQPQLRVG